MAHPVTASLQHTLMVSQLSQKQKVVLMSCWIAPLARLRKLHRLLFVADKVCGIVVLALVGLSTMLHTFSMNHALQETDPALARTLSNWTVALGGATGIVHSIFLSLQLARMATTCAHVADVVEKLGRGMLASLQTTPQHQCDALIADFLQQVEGAMHSGGKYSAANLSSMAATVKSDV